MEKKQNKKTQVKRRNKQRRKIVNPA